MLLVDTLQGKVISDDELKETYAKRQPYGEWLDSNLVELKNLKIPNLPVQEYSRTERARLQKAFGYSYEEYPHFHPQYGAERLRGHRVHGRRHAAGRAVPINISRCSTISNSCLHR